MPGKGIKQFLVNTVRSATFALRFFLQTLLGVLIILGEARASIECTGIKNIG